jgi:hypothetical protein
MCVEFSRRLGESQSPKINNNSGEKSNCQNEHSSEKLINYQTVKRKLRLKNSLEKQSNECANCQMLEYSFQKGMKLANSVKKLETNWHKVNNSIATNIKVPFKMKRKTFVKAKKMIVKMKENRKQPIWKAKMEN